MGEYERVGVNRSFLIVSENTSEKSHVLSRSISRLLDSTNPLSTSPFSSP